MNEQIEQDRAAAASSVPSSEEVDAHQARIEAMGAELAELAATLFAGEARFVRLVGEFDDLGGWADGQTRSCAHWLNWRLGIAMPAARERVRVARRLRDLPLIAGAFAKGQLSYSKVRALTRVASGATDEVLLGYALHSTAAQLEHICRKWRRVQRLSAPDVADAQQQHRQVSSVTDDDGMAHLRADLPGDDGALVNRALDAAMQALFDEHGPPGPDEADARRADALVLMARSFLASGPTGSSSTERWQLVVHADADALANATDGEEADIWQPPADPEGIDSHPPVVDVGMDGPLPVAETENGPMLAGPVLRRLACDSTLVGMATAPDGAPVGVGRRTRVIAPWLRKLLNARDRCCAFPGCQATRWTDAHHIVHWANGGVTALHNLIRLCRYHHTRVHNQSIAITRDSVTHEWVFQTRDGQPLRSLTALPDPGSMPTAGPVFPSAGDPARMSLIVDGLVLAEARSTGQNVSAETSPPD